MDQGGICAIVGAAEFNAAHFAGERFDMVIAADGGFTSLEANGIVPDVALGDFDSLGFVPKARQVVRYPSVKDDSDTVLALDHAFRQGYRNVVVYGALGGRPDHTLATQQALVHCARRGMHVAAVGADGVEVALHGGPCDMTDDVPPQGSGDTAAAAPSRRSDGNGRDGGCGDGMPLSRITVPAGLRGPFSVFAMCDEAQGVTERGAFYEVEDVSLFNDVPLGLSNEFTGSSVEISVADGDLLVFLPLLPASPLL